MHRTSNQPMHRKTGSGMIKMTCAKQNVRVVLLAVCAMAVTACVELGNGPQNTVDWYAAHPVERANKLMRCHRDNAESLGESCANAEKAEKIAHP